MVTISYTQKIDLAIVIIESTNVQHQQNILYTYYLLESIFIPKKKNQKCVFSLDVSNSQLI